MKKFYYSTLFCLFICLTNNYSFCQCFFHIQDSLLQNVGPYSKYGSAPAFVDIDNDTDYDLFAGTYDGRILFYENEGSVSQASYTLYLDNNNSLNFINVGTNSRPTFVDIDNDGDQDAFITNYDSISFYKNVGDSYKPSFKLKNSPISDTIVLMLSFIDIDNDGDQDAFTATYYNYNYSINYYQNTGNATNAIFSLQNNSNNPFYGNYFWEINAPVFVDIDDDGDFDAFIGNSDDVILDFYLNTGTANSPALTKQKKYDNPLNAVDMYNIVPAFVDIDNDNDWDAYIGDEQGNITLYKNYGTSKSPLFVCEVGIKNPLIGFEIERPVFVDIDQDEDYDLFTGSIWGTIDYYENVGNKTSPIYLQRFISSNPFNNINLGKQSTLAFVDIDKDNDYDAFVGTSKGNIYYCKNTGSATSPVFVNQQGNLNPFDGVDVGEDSEISFVDIDNDGDQDAYIGESMGNINYYKNTGNTFSPIFTKKTGINNPLDSVDIGLYSDVSFVDIDNDNDFDAFVGNNDGKIIFYQNVGTNNSPNFVYQPVYNKFQGVEFGQLFYPSFVDIDADADMDVFFKADYESSLLSEHPTLVYYENVGTPITENFQNSIYTENPLSNIYMYYGDPEFVDINNDGDLDLFMGGGGYLLEFYENVGNAYSPMFHIPYPGIQLDSNYNPLAATLVDIANYSDFSSSFVDIDNDSDYDAFIGQQNNTTLFYKNTGSATSPNFVLTSGNNNPLNGIKSQYVKFVDMDDDKDYDLFMNGTVEGSIEFYRNIGTATSAVFQKQTGSLNPLASVSLAGKASPTFADMDNDGDLDVLIGDHWYTTLHYYTNIGDAKNPVFKLDTSGNTILSLISFDGSGCNPELIDINKDGDIDLFIGRGDVIYLENKCDLLITSIATEQESLNTNIKLYPNPAQDYLTIEATTFSKAAYQVSIIDLLGKQVSTYSITQSVTNIPLNHLNRGVYIIKVRGESNESFSEKIIVQ